MASKWLTGTPAAITPAKEPSGWRYERVKPTRGTFDTRPVIGSVTINRWPGWARCSAKKSRSA